MVISFLLSDLEIVASEKCCCISRKHSSLSTELRLQVSPENSMFPV